MTILDWLFIGCCSAFLIAFVIALFSFALSFATAKDFNELKKRRPKNKQKRKRWQRNRQQLKKKKNAQVKRGIIFIVLSILFLSGGLYARYYQLTNLSKTDGNIIVQSYFVTDEVNKTLTSLQNGSDVGESKQKLMELTSLLASYGSSTPSNGLSKEGQTLLNRYYVQLREYGSNTYSLSEEQLNNQETVSTYINDLKRIEQTQKKVFKEFNVNETALKQKK
ncbi:YccF domain-containing protein [Enterococcus sp. AZ126]|uniref:YccF domain-containing protein n=1 Tax=Enterococcus sp. AZ126 TaxID=2774635 RepID=UPI003F1EF9BA